MAVSRVCDAPHPPAARVPPSPRMRGEGWGEGLLTRCVIRGGSILLDIPEEDHRGNDDPMKILSVRGRRYELTGWHIGYVTLVGFGLDVGRELFLRVKIGGLE